MTLSIEEKKELLEELKKELMKSQKIYVEICKEGVQLPQYANFGDAGMDIRAAQETIILPGETKIVPTGLKMVIPQGYELQIRPRSGLSAKTPLRITNTPGTIDSGYRGEIGIIVNNSSEILNSSIKLPTYSIDEKGNKPGIYHIKFGDRIAQIVLAKYETINFVPVDNVKILGFNRGGGFGSTGTK